MDYQEAIAADMTALMAELGEEITVYPKSGNSSYGPVFGAGVTETAYIESGNKVVTDKKGQEVVASLFSIHGGDCTIKIEDEMVYDDDRYAAIAVDKFRQAGDVLQVEVHWGSVRV